MNVRTWIVLPLVLVAASGCNAGENPPSADPHPPDSDEERVLAERYREFVGALERRDADGVCGQLERELAESYGCGGGRVRIPREVRELEVTLEEVFAARDPSVGNQIEILARSRRSDSEQLIVYYRQGDDREWRIREAMVGARAD
jgi:hypothetical protein